MFHSGQRWMCFLPVTNSGVSISLVFAFYKLNVRAQSEMLCLSCYLWQSVEGPARDRQWLITVLFTMAGQCLKQHLTV